MTDSHLSLIRNPGRPDSFLISRVGDGSSRQPLELFGTTLRLFVQQDIHVVDDENRQDGKRCQTVSYIYRLQESDEKQSWLLRWEYFREPPRSDYVYPLAHLHVAARFKSASGIELEHLHLPTHRVPLELVMWHLIAEWGVAPRSEGWQETYEQSIAGFRQRRSD